MHCLLGRPQPTSCGQSKRGSLHPPRWSYPTDPVLRLMEMTRPKLGKASRNILLYKKNKLATCSFCTTKVTINSIPNVSEICFRDFFACAISTWRAIEVEWSGEEKTRYRMHSVGHSFLPGHPSNLTTTGEKRRKNRRWCFDCFRILCNILQIPKGKIRTPIQEGIERKQFPVKQQQQNIGPAE